VYLPRACVGSEEAGIRVYNLGEYFLAQLGGATNEEGDPDRVCDLLARSR